MMKAFWIALTVAFLTGLCGIASAQTPPVVTASSHLAFDQPAPDLPTAQGYTYRSYIDTATTGTVAASVTCVAGASAGVQTCTIPFPASTPGAHTLTLTAADVAGEGPKSPSFAFTLVVVPGAPANIRAVP